MIKYAMNKRQIQYTCHILTLHFTALPFAAPYHTLLENFKVLYTVLYYAGVYCKKL